MSPFEEKKAENLLCISFEQIISDYVNLFRHPNVKIIMSAIIPCPVDHDVSDPIIRK